MKKLLTLSEVEARIGFKKSYIYKLARKHRFPKPYKFNRSSRWDSDDIDAWILKAIEKNGKV